MGSQSLLSALLWICLLHGDEHLAVGGGANEGLQAHVSVCSLTCPRNTHAGFQPRKEQLLARFIGSLLTRNPGTRSPLERVHEDH